nr:dna repair protein rad16 [Quercus suber]
MPPQALPGFHRAGANAEDMPRCTRQPMSVYGGMPTCLIVGGLGHRTGRAADVCSPVRLPLASRCGPEVSADSSSSDGDLSWSRSVLPSSSFLSPNILGACFLLAPALSHLVLEVFRREFAVKPLSGPDRHPSWPVRERTKVQAIPPCATRDHPSYTLVRNEARHSPAVTERTIAPSMADFPDLDSDYSDEIIVLPSKRRYLKEVSIPNMSPTDPPHMTATRPASDSTSLSSGRSTPGADNIDTPGTTPAGSHKGGAAVLKRKRNSRLDGNAVSARSVQEVGQDAGADADADADLARQLQEEEYSRQMPGSVKRARTNDYIVEDAAGESSGLSELDELESDEDFLDTIPLRRRSTLHHASQDQTPVEPTGSNKGKGKVAITPRRAASLRARASLRKKAVVDESGSELSEQESDDNFHVDDESEVASFESSDAESDNVATSRKVASPTPPRPNEKVRGRDQRGARRRRFGNHTADDATRINAEVEAVVEDGLLGRKERERKKLEKAHSNLKTMWSDLKKTPIIQPVQAPQPASITRKLKPFQLEGLDWMTRQEKTQYKGGLLGDEMGMGKTIQAVSLIMSDYPQKEPTLVIVPPVALMQWSTEIREYTDGKLKVLVYHGQNSKVKNMSVKELKKNDVIMISYNSLESLHRKETKGWSRGEDIVKEDSPIHAIHFHRLILDEAHSIKSRTTGVAKACFALQGTYKWCLSGTPVQNRIGEFFSLLRFLEVRPFADYFCKKCPCAILHWKLNDDHMCVNCKHSGIEHVSVFNQELLNPLTTSESRRTRQKAMDKLHMITARIMLRRMKRDHVSSMELPPKEVIVHNEFFGEIERDFSSSIMTNTNVLVCNICDEVAEEAIRSQCKHDFCRSCVRSYMHSVEADAGEADCPRCHIPLAIDLDQPDIEQDEDNVKKSSIINRIKMENWTSSTKIEMLIYDLYKLRSKKQTLKSIVFSQFTSMLQLIEWRLRRAGFNTVMLDGSMTPIQRQRSIEYFMNNTNVEVFLVSLKAGGVALNLTEASRVFIVDPWWNPAAEWQSADRCHRIGQKRPCVITRLCIEDSVESRMVMLQEKKANMINGTINNDKASMEKLTPEDMTFLFRGT